MNMRASSLSFLALTITASHVASQDKEMPLLLQRPSLSADRIAFVFAGDLWTVARSGGDARRLTNTPLGESNPVFSPDGTQIAFTRAEGGADVYVMPSEGGVPRRLTFHPALDLPVGWTPDGRRVLFTSGRVRNQAHMGSLKLFSIPAEGGFPEELPLPQAGDGAYSPDGQSIAYVQKGMVFPQTWKRYRGGLADRVLLANTRTLQISSIPRTNSNDIRPMWVGNTVYFLSDREGTNALFRYDVASGRVTKVIDNHGFDLKWAAAGPGAIVYEQFGSLHLFDLATQKSHRVPVRIPEDLPQTQPRTVNVGGRFDRASLSPDGSQVALEARGEILVLDVATGKVRPITNTSRAVERDSAWSPDGRWIAYFSDESGEYELHLRSASGPQLRKIRLGEKPVFYTSPVWSPDSQRIAYLDCHLGLWYVDTQIGLPVLIDRDHYQWETDLTPVWSPDGRWIAYRKQLPSRLGAIHLYSLETRESSRITDETGDCSKPAFDKNGRYLYFLASTDAGPSREVEVLKTTRRTSSRVYAAVLSRLDSSPLAASESALSGPIRSEARVDLEGLGRRMIALPFPPARYVALKSGRPAELFAAESTDGRRVSTIHRLNLTKPKPEVLAAGVTAFNPSASGERALWRLGTQWFSSDASGREKTPLRVKEIEVHSEPKREWEQIYHEAWRLVRDFFYDPQSHGLDLKSAEQRYQPFLKGLASRQDLNYLLAEMVSELSVGHISVGGGEDAPQSNSATCGLLGADYRIENGRYRFSRIYRGESWNPDIAAPLAQPGLEVSAGDYLLAVNGKDLAGTGNIFSAFAGTVGKPTTVSIASTAEGGGMRQVTVTPIANEWSLRHADWVEQNRKRVDQATSGRVAYIFLPDTGGEGARRFLREFYAQADKQAAIVDVRFNGGGEHGTDVVEYLVRRPLNFTTTRSGQDFPQPTAIPGPKVMLINEFSGSGGDLLPWYFRQARAGILIGKRTWGGVVGLWGRAPSLLDGGFLVVPSGLSWNPNGTWDLENVGVPPDIEVEQEPRLVREGKDPQLEKAIEVVLDELKKHPPIQPKRPAYPGRNDRAK